MLAKNYKKLSSPGNIFKITDHNIYSIDLDYISLQKSVSKNGKRYLTFCFQLLNYLNTN